MGCRSQAEAGDRFLIKETFLTLVIATCPLPDLTSEHVHTHTA